VWTELNRRSNVAETNGKGKIVAFPVVASEFFRAVRIKQLDNCWNGKDGCVILAAFEIFRDLAEQP
jgi:hypothetical protein